MGNRGRGAVALPGPAAAATCGSSGLRRSRTSSRWAGGERRGGDLSLSNPRIPNRQILGFLIDKLSGL